MPQSQDEERHRRTAQRAATANLEPHAGSLAHLRRGRRYKTLEQLARFLEPEHESAARSLREGMAEMFTVQRLQLPPSLYKCLGTTNVIESPQSGVQKRTHNVTRWRDADMVERWVASAWLLPRNISAKSSAIAIFGPSPSFLEENENPTPTPRRWRNMKLSRSQPSTKLGTPSRRRRPMPGLLLHTDVSKHCWFQKSHRYDLIDPRRVFTFSLH